MPNWVEGTFKVRGTLSNIERFVRENILDAMISIDKCGGDLELEILGEAYVKDSNRTFIYPGNYYSFERDGINTNTLTLQFKAAWRVYIDPFVKMSKDYNVDIKIYGFEKGSEFNQDIVIINGEVIKNDIITFNDYAWECPFPDLGG